MKISKELAQKVLDAFGPCTTLYECTEIDELIEMVEAADSLADFIKTEISCEEIHAEHHMEAAYQQEASGEEHYKGKHKKVIDECERSIAGVKERTAALLKEIESATQI